MQSISIPFSNPQSYNSSNASSPSTSLSSSPVSSNLYDQIDTLVMDEESNDIKDICLFILNHADEKVPQNIIAREVSKEISNDLKGVTEITTELFKKVKKNIGKIVRLHLCACRVNGHLLDKLPNSIGVLKGLKYLTATSNKLVTIPESLTKTQLIEIDISNNEAKMNPLPKFLLEMSTLQRIIVSKTDIAVSRSFATKIDASGVMQWIDD